MELSREFERPGPGPGEDDESDLSALLFEKKPVIFRRSKRDRTGLAGAVFDSRRELPRLIADLVFFIYY